MTMPGFCESQDDIFSAEHYKCPDTVDRCQLEKVEKLYKRHRVPGTVHNFDTKLSQMYEICMDGSDVEIVLLMST